jgi:hypothetical protein
VTSTNGCRGSSSSSTPPTGRIGDLDVGGTEIIGYDEASDTYSTYFFDSAGNVTTEELTVRDGVWTWQGETTRATSVFSDDGKAQTCRYERSEDAVNWAPAMQVTSCVSTSDRNSPPVVDPLVAGTHSNAS